MRVLLDTCSFLWIVTDARELSTTAREIFQDPGNDIYLSSISTWEIAVKHALDRLPLPAQPENYIPQMRHDHGIETLPLDEEATLQLGRLPVLHRDPFDRMLVCQAIVGGMVLLTPDQVIARYPVRSMW